MADNQPQAALGAVLAGSQPAALLSLLQSLPAEARSQLHALLGPAHGAATPTVRRLAPCYQCRLRREPASCLGCYVEACTCVQAVHSGAHLVAEPASPRAHSLYAAFSLKAAVNTQGPAAPLDVARGANGEPYTTAGAPQKALSRRRFVSALNSLARGETLPSFATCDTQTAYEEVRPAADCAPRWWEQYM